MMKELINEKTRTILPKCNNLIVILSRMIKQGRTKYQLGNYLITIGFIKREYKIFEEVYTEFISNKLGIKISISDNLNIFINYDLIQYFVIKCKKCVKYCDISYYLTNTINQLKLDKDILEFIGLSF